MALRRFALVMLVTLALVAAAAAAEAASRAGRDKAYDSVVQVIVETRFGTVRRVSGYLFSPNGYVLTAYHALTDATAISVFHSGFGVFEVDRIRRIDPRANVAVLGLAHAGGAGLVSARLGDSRSLRVGDPVHVMHHPAHGETVLHNTKIQAIGYARQLDSCYLTDSYASELLLIQVEGPFDAGSAGGMVLNDNYDVIGVLVGGCAATESGRVGYALASSYFSPLLLSTYDVAWESLRTDYASDAEYFDRLFGPAPQLMDYQAPMREGYIVWFAPIHHTEYADYEFTYEINDKIDKNWFYTDDLEVDGRPLREWSAARILIWPAHVNPWDAGDTFDQYVHFDADSLFSKRIYRDRDTEERIMTRHLLALALAPGRHSIRYQNKGANYKLTGMRSRRVEIGTARIEPIDIEGLSLVTMLLLPDTLVRAGEGDPVRYELERRPLGEKEINECIRRVRFPAEL